MDIPENIKQILARQEPATDAQVDQVKHCFVTLTNEGLDWSDARFMDPFVKWWKTNREGVRRSNERAKTKAPNNISPKLMLETLKRARVQLLRYSEADPMAEEITKVLGDTAPVIPPQQREEDAWVYDHNGECLRPKSEEEILPLIPEEIRTILKKEETPTDEEFSIVRQYLRLTKQCALLLPTKLFAAWVDKNKGEIVAWRSRTSPLPGWVQS